jgi:hypothetical protein
MASRPAVPKYKAPAEKASAWRLISTALTGFAILALPFLQANSEVDWAVYEIMGQVVYRAPMPKPSVGGFYSKNVEIDLGESYQTMRIGEVSLDVNPVWQLARTYTFKLGRKIGASSATVTFDRIENPDGFPWGSLQGEIALGGISMVPAEAEGCGAIGEFGQTQISEMGLSVKPLRVTENIEIDDELITLTQRFESPGIATTTITKVGEGQRLNKEILQSYGLPGEIRWTRHSLEIQDQAFVKARNAYCAKKLGLSEAQFLAYHIASVERLLSATGLEASVEMRASYLDFATNGGALKIEGTYNKAILEADFYDIEWREQLGNFSGSMTRLQTSLAEQATRQTSLAEQATRQTSPAAQATRQTSSPFMLRLATETPFDDADIHKTTYQILQEEGFVLASNANAEGAEAAQGSLLETQVVEVKVAPSLTSTVIVIPDEEAEYIGNIAQLSRYVGRRVRIERRFKEPVIGKILGMSAGGVRLRISKGGGYVDLVLPKQDFSRARLFPVR